jgi:hypothetical protein
LPHVPQFALSRLGSTQLEPQATCGGVQLVAQWPRVQTWPSPQAVPQAPQLAPSSVRSTHLPAQAVVPSRQAQLPPVQTESVPQTFPHAPQFASSESSAMQAPPQSA